MSSYGKNANPFNDLAGAQQKSIGTVSAGIAGVMPSKAKAGDVFYDRLKTTCKLSIETKAKASSVLAPITMQSVGQGTEVAKTPLAMPEMFAAYNEQLDGIRDSLMRINEILDSVEV